MSESKGQPAANTSELSALLGEQWQPIETAPRDGTEVLVTGLEYGRGPGRWMHVAAYAVDVWIVAVDPPQQRLHEPTHWMPKPPPPNAS